MGQQNTTKALIVSYDNLATLIDAAEPERLKRTLLICDEVHNMGSEGRREALSERLSVFGYRLGLSATPLDPYDETRNEFLTDEVGPVVFEFGLEDAIRRGILCELSYVPLEYSLSEDDKEEQRAQFKKYKALKERDPTISKAQLYIMLARIRKASEEKLPVFKQYLAENPEILDDCLIFVETMDYGTKVQEIIHDYTHSYRTYYGVDNEVNLDDFSNGEVSVLITSRAISEGIDIKSVRNIILFTSDRSKGKTIQRVGRALRTDPDDPDKVANVVDFVVSEDINYDPETDEDERVPPDYERYHWFKQIDNVTQEE
jgi:superfamily II DNA or RNA helicase